MKHSFLLFATAICCNLMAPAFAMAQQPTSEWANVSYQPPAEVLVKLETSGCRGYCPVYKLTFNVDGTLIYSGYRHVPEVGEKYAKLTADEFSKLKMAVNRANLWEHPRQLPEKVVDAPNHTLTVYDKDKKH
ncbi:MAG TPA: DUF6438 domain-containing protein, partial [Saprospiraceae bacterium]|nr:DUF6438 domain-containing protein [Saprospiraceae bacterium]